MSLRKKTIQYAAAAVFVSIAIIAASFVIGIPAPSFLTTSSSAQAGQSATLAIRLTDPPQVPGGTTSLNLTYSSLSLLVGEPTGTPGQLDTKSVAVNASGGSATLDLLKLQNVSQTIATASLPSGSTLYSVTFTVTGINIDVNGTVSAVSLATGGSDFTVTIAQPRAFGTGDFALLQLNPVVVSTSTGYQLIPSSIGVMRHGEGVDEHVGDRHQMSNEDNHDLEHARGNVTASLVALSVSGNVTTVTVELSNVGNVSVRLNAIGLHGNFTALGSFCGNSDSGNGYTPMREGDSVNTTNSMGSHCEPPFHMDQVVFIPVSPSSSSTSTTTTAGCTAGQMRLVNGEMDVDHLGLTLNAGQCVRLTFVGEISFGMSHFDLVPSTSSGQTYILHAIASNGANEAFSCVLPLGANSCTALPQQSEQD